MRRQVRQGGEGGVSRRLRREELAEAWPGLTKEAARASRGASVDGRCDCSVLQMAMAGQGRRQAVWESEWQWRIECANVLRMNGPNSRERERLSLRGPCATKDMDRSER
jgi:hypothetical protein